MMGYLRKTNETGHCRWCAPGKFPQGGHQNEGHLAIRLNPSEAVRSRAFLNGIDVSNRCTEAIPGDDGVVVLYDTEDNGNFMGCPCLMSACQHVERGEVRVSRELYKEVTQT